jgi:hypothetical protein
MIVTASITLLAAVCAALTYEVLKLKKRVEHVTALADDIQNEFWPRLKEVTASLAKLDRIRRTTVESRIDDAIARLDRAIETHPTGGADQGKQMTAFELTKKLESMEPALDGALALLSALTQEVKDLHSRLAITQQMLVKLSATKGAA